ncbi:MAG TPA: DUF4136 domain-containing protein [Vicinamibacterales bacterium]|jgi:hypothetical protein|nr:DUF4136 domain-containing protein [Vicinamibacterales bacterium]
MKRLIVTCIVVASAVAVAGQSPKYGIAVTAEKDVDFAKFKTYSWMAGQPSAIKAVDAQIVAAVDRELAGLAMKKATSGPGDVVVSYYSLSRTDVDLKAKPDAKGARPGYSVGSLGVVLLEPASRRRLLQLRVDEPIETQAEELAATIDRVVAEMFAKYPTRQTK